MLIGLLKGGPGCSSFDGLMMEVGPWRMDGKGGFKTMEGGWEEYTTMIYGTCSPVLLDFLDHH
jgi:carboxypeptidase C (cathepsin A)